MRFDRELGKTVAFVRLTDGRKKSIPIDEMINEPAHLFIEFLKEIENGEEEEGMRQVDQTTLVIPLAHQLLIAVKPGDDQITNSVSKSTADGEVSSDAHAPEIAQKLTKNVMPHVPEETYLGKRHAEKLYTEQKEQAKRQKRK